MLLRLPAALSLMVFAACATASGPNTDDATSSRSVAGSTDDQPDGAVTPEPAQDESPRHVLLVILDDFGIDAAPMYGAPDDGRTYAPMPVVSAICDEGLQFHRAWSSPTCSPTRAGLMTGRYSFRHGIGAPIGATVALPLDEVTLPEVLAASDPRISLANIGKWHLGISDAIGGREAPNRHGWPHFAGTLDGYLEAFDDWLRVENGVSNSVTEYATSRTVDDAILWLGEQERDDPWLLWLAFNAPHDPFHVPPADLHSYTDLATDEDTIAEAPLQHYQASLEALDTELGRLLSWIERNDHGPVDIIVMGDNGTPRQVIDEAIGSTHAKGSIFEGGINVPLCIRGPSVTDGGRGSDALVQTLDIFSTIADLFAVDLERFQPAPQRDAVSLVPILDGTAATTRGWVFTERFPSDDTDITAEEAIRSDRYKLLRSDLDDDGIYETEEMYDLDRDPLEQDNLLQDTLLPRTQLAYDELTAQLDSIE